MNWRVRLVDDWRHGWKWLSAWFAGIGAIASGSMAASVKGSIAVAFKVAGMFIGVLKLRWVFLILAVVFVGGFIGRFVCQKPKAKPDGQQ